MPQLLSVIQRILNRFGVVAIRKSTHDNLIDKSRLARRFELLRYFGKTVEVAEFISVASKSRSQLDQDLAALASSGMKRNGYFVEFGATDGITLSNTFLLEDGFGWTGVLAEPGMQWADSLKRNRSAHIITKAVWSETGKTFDFIEAGELSTLAAFENSDHHVRRGRKYRVETISLNDLLVEADSPKHIDFLSIDTEGTELEILENLDFSTWSFGFICVEHNFTPNEAKLDSILASAGYKRVLADVSEWDAWYVPIKSS